MTAAAIVEQPTVGDFARARVLRLAAERSHAWRMGDVGAVQQITEQLEYAWADVRLEQAQRTPYRPRARTRAQHNPADIRFRLGEYCLDRFLLDACCDRGAVTLGEFAAALHAWTVDPEERADLPTNRQLAVQLRERGVELVRRGGVVWLVGLSVAVPDRSQQDEIAHMPEARSHLEVA